MFRDIVRHGNATITIWNEELNPRAGIKEIRETPYTNVIMCRDGFTFSVRAGQGFYCWPRPGWFAEKSPPSDYPGPYTHVEVGFFGHKLPKPEGPWLRYMDAPKRRDVSSVTVFAYVPKRLVYDLIRRHGGEIEPFEYAIPSYRLARMAGHRGRFRTGLRNMVEAMRESEWEYGADAYRG